MSIWTVVRPVPIPPAWISQAWGNGGVNGVGGHPGEDYACDMIPVYSPAEGEVVYAGYADGFGPNTVVIWYGQFGVMMRFGHMAAMDVKATDHVMPGQQIGISGTMGNSTGVHLHFEVDTAYRMWGGNPTNINSEAWLLQHLGDDPPSTPDDEELVLNADDKKWIAEQIAAVNNKIDAAQRLLQFTPDNNAYHVVSMTTLNKKIDRLVYVATKVATFLKIKL